MINGLIAGGLPAGTLPAMIDKIFHAYDIRATYPNPLSEEDAWRVGHATAQYLKRSRQNLGSGEQMELENTLVVGRDMRPSSPDLARNLMDGIRSVGMDVIDIGMVDTSMVYFAINHLGCVGGIMTTASHNPVQYNGFKISGPLARPIGSASGLDDIKRIAAGLRIGKTGVEGGYEQRDLWEAYRAHVLKFLKLDRPLTVAVDASNGMAGQMIPKVFGAVPGLRILPLLFEITGSFVHEPNPLVTSNLSMLQELVCKERPDLGACFDGDADRCMFVDETGRPIGSDLMTALMARYLLSQPENAGATVVYDLRSSHSVPETIVAAGGKARRDRVGHAFIKKTMAETGAIFGGEVSGHIYFKDNFFADSAAIAFALSLTIVSQQAGPISSLIEPLRRYSSSGEVNFHVEDKEAKIRQLAERYQRGRIDYLDGITIELDEWWFNVRKSNTEPLLRLNVEAASEALLAEKFDELKTLLGKPVSGH